MTNDFQWTIGRNGEASIQFSKGEMVFFEEDTKEKGLDDVLYFYYTVTVRLGEKKLEFTVSDFPKAQYLNAAIQEIVSHETWEKGYPLEDFEKGQGRKIRYHQLELEDTFWMEYFVRLEKYCYGTDSEEPDSYHTDFKMTIGELSVGDTTETGIVAFFNQISEEELLRLGKVAEDFCNHTLSKTNNQNT